MKTLKLLCCGLIIFFLLFSFSATTVSAAPISSGAYSLTAIVGSYAWGCTDWNAADPLGYVDNIADIGTVQALLSDGYVFQPQGCTSNPNGIYNWDPVLEGAGLHVLEFDFNGGTNYLLNSLSFISSRSYSDGTPISIEYALDGGAWIVAASTTSGGLGITTGDANTYVISLGGVLADRFRFVTNGGDQVSVHEIIIDGMAPAVPGTAGNPIFAPLPAICGVPGASSLCSQGGGPVLR